MYTIIGGYVLHYAISLFSTLGITTIICSNRESQLAIENSGYYSGDGENKFKGCWFKMKSHAIEN